tara:strand:+ start:350 stop:1342 length:993 start_codon:yes stop_codon:yes gene_type:complete
MAFSTAIQTALTFLASLNPNRYDENTNPGGMGDIGYQKNWAKGLNHMAEVANAIDAKAEAVDGAATDLSAAVASAQQHRDDAGDFKDQTQTLRDEAETFRDQAASSVAAAQYPVVTTGGTGAAYTANFDPDLVVVDGAAFRLNIHAANLAQPTLAVDGGTAKELVRNNFGDAIEANELPNGSIAVVHYESTLDKYVVLGLQDKRWRVDVDADGKTLSGQVSEEPVTLIATVSENGTQTSLPYRWPYADAGTVVRTTVNGSAGAVIADIAPHVSGATIGGGAHADVDDNTDSIAHTTSNTINQGDTLGFEASSFANAGDISLTFHIRRKHL